MATSDMQDIKVKHSSFTIRSFDVTA